MTLDEILAEVTAIAKDPDAGADRFRALKMLASSETAAVAIPDPAKEVDITVRLARLMLGAGVRLTQIAYVKAFPWRTRAIQAGPVVKYEDAAPELVEESKRFTSLKMLNKYFPEGKVLGTPKGYPVGRSIAMKIEWCQHQALKMLVERQERDRQKLEQELKAGDSGMRPDATNGSKSITVPEDLQGV